MQDVLRHKKIKIVAISLDRSSRAEIMQFVTGLKLRHLDIVDPDGHLWRRAKSKVS
jgi:hypothetical protein